ARPDRVLVDRERGAPALELVLDLDGRARELAELAPPREPRVEPMRARAAASEAARLYPDPHGDSLALVPVRQEVDDTAEGRAVLQQRRDVLEQDPLRREILDVSYFRPQLGKIHAAHITGLPGRWRGAHDAPGGPECPRGVAA